MSTSIRPGSTVVRRLSPPQTRADQRGIVICLIEERRISGSTSYADVRWISPDGSANDGAVRHDPDELEVVE